MRELKSYGLLAADLKGSISRVQSRPDYQDRLGSK